MGTGVFRVGLVAASFALAAPAPLQEPSATFFLGRVKFSNNDGNDCRNTGRDHRPLLHLSFCVICGICGSIFLGERPS